MNKDLVYNFEYAEGIAPADYTATQTGSAIDCLGALDILCVITLNDDTTIDASHYFTFSWTECATSGGTYTAVPAAQIKVADSWDKIWNAAAEANNFHHVQVNLSAGMRYLKCVATETGTAQGSFGVDVMFTMRHQPASA